jgi:hypothetical protein
VRLALPLTRIVQINGQNSSYSDDGQGDVSVSLSVSFFPTWAGTTLQFFGQAVDDSMGSSSGWWQVPESSFLVLGASQGSPALGTVAPPNGSVTISQWSGFGAAYLTFTASDPNGWQAINELGIVISPNHSAVSACAFVFFPYLSTVYLFDDAFQYWT